jgi:hypothetical protein
VWYDYFNKIQIRFHFADDTFYLFWSYSPKKYQNIHGNIMPSLSLGRRGHDRMVVGFRTTYAIGAYHHYAVSLNLDQGKLYNIM